MLQWQANFTSAQREETETRWFEGIRSFCCAVGAPETMSLMMNEDCTGVKHYRTTILGVVKLRSKTLQLPESIQA